MIQPVKRCAWVNDDPLYINYHDSEWGVPIYDERLLFEFLILEGMQAGLSWITVLRKRESFREAFDHFEPEIMARYSPAKINACLQNAGIIRNRLKVESAVINAKSILQLWEKDETLSRLLWDFVDNKPLVNHWHNSSEVPAKTDISDKMSKDLKKKGFKFVGSTICYALMQATGLINDHLTSCFRHQELIN